MKKVMKKIDLVKTVAFHKKCYDNPGSVDILLRYLHGKVIAWVSCKESKTTVGCKFNPNCLLQLDNHVLPVYAITFENSEELAMLRGMYEIAGHITKPCSVYLVTDRDLFNGCESELTVRQDDFLSKSVIAFNEKGCSITELVIKDGKELIYKQVEKPVTDIAEISDQAPLKEIGDIIGKSEKLKPKAKDEELVKNAKRLTQEDVQDLKNAMNSGMKKEVKPNNNQKKRETKTNTADTIIDGVSIHCRVCNRIFIMSSSEVDFYHKKGFQLPRRCKDCRDKKIRYSDADYFDRGLKHNSYQQNLDMYGPRINVNGGLENSPGYRLAQDRNGKSTYVRKFGGKIETLKKRHL